MRRWLKRWGQALAALCVLVTAVFVLSRTQERPTALADGGMSVLIEARSGTESRYCSGTAVRGWDGVVTAAHCVQDSVVTLVSWAGREWDHGDVVIGENDTAFVHVDGIGMTAGAVEIGEIEKGPLRIAAWQGATRAVRSTRSCVVESWTVMYAHLSMMCGLLEGGSGAGVLQNGRLVGVVTSQLGNGINLATSLRFAHLRD